MKSWIVALVLMVGAGLVTKSAAATPHDGVIKSAVTAKGLVADLYVPAKLHGRQPAIIVLGGSEGGLSAGAARDAKLIAQHGYVTLQLAYFDAPGLPKELGLIPLEYFKTAIDWLRAQPNVDADRIGIEGTSIGGEAALVVASHYPEIKAVVAAVPSNVVWPGISHTDRNPPSSWTLGGVPLPDLPYGRTEKFTNIYDLYAEGLKALDQHPDAIIPVERINGPVMLICGESDTLWPSCEMATQAFRRLKAHGFKPRLELLSYADAGHAAFGPPVARDDPRFASLGELGGSPAGNAAARGDNWRLAMFFMDTALMP